MGAGRGLRSKDLNLFNLHEATVADDVLTLASLQPNEEQRISDRDYAKACALQIAEARFVNLAPRVRKVKGFKPPMLRAARSELDLIVTLKAVKCSETDKNDFVEMTEKHLEQMGLSHEEASEKLEVNLGDQLTIKINDDIVFPLSLESLVLM